MTYVVIPAYNEQATIRQVVDRFLANDRTTAVIVIVDRQTTDKTAIQAVSAAGRPVRLYAAHRLVVLRSQYHGKGQNVTIALRNTRGREVVLCDADVTISDSAVSALMRPLGAKMGQLIVVPKQPTGGEWQAAESAVGVKFDHESWPWVSGVRRVRVHLIPPTIYGYLTETLINKFVNASSTPYSQFVYDDATTAPLRFTPERINDLHAHGRYGKEKGLI